MEINKFTMNKILYVARKAKGFTQEQVAKALQMEEMAYKEMEASLSDVTADIALRVSKLYNIDAELFIYTEGREQSLIKFAMNEIANFKKSGILKELAPQQLFYLVSLGNTALALQAELNHCLFRQYELEKDNEALRQLNSELKNKLQNDNG
jgi:transcriptional regulator with XRE-family HTH domain